MNRRYVARCVSGLPVQHAYGWLPALIGLHGRSRQEDTRVEAHGVRVSDRLLHERISCIAVALACALGWLSLSRWNLERFPDATRFFSRMKALGCMVGKSRDAAT